jgi:hypothetical protein
MIPQLIIILLGLLDLGEALSKHGEKKKQTDHNGWISLFSLIILWTLLYYGGFWNPMI